MSATSPQVETPRPTSSAKYLTLTAMLFAVAMMFIDQTIVSIAAPTIEEDLGISDESVQWIINGYLLSLAALFALGGRLSDVLGHKRMVLVGVVVFAVASAMCGLTPSGSFASAWIIGFRVIQGAGAAIMFPAALAIVVASFPIRERGRALAIFFAVSGALTAIGPIAGGYLIEWSWRAIFWINIPIAIIAIILTAMIKTDIAPKKDKIDWAGAVLVIIGMGLSVLGFQQANSWGWDNFKTIGCIVVGALFLVLFVLFESKRETPLIKVRIFKDRAFSVDNAVLFFSMMTFVPAFFFMSDYAQISLGYSATDAGIFLMWFFLGVVVTSQIGGKMLDQSGAKLPMILGCIIGLVGYALWAWKSTSLSGDAITPYVIMAGAGIGFLLGPASTDAVNRAIGASYGEVTGITQTVRYYGSSVGFAILGTIMITVSGNDIVRSLLGLGVPQAQADLIVDSMSGHTSGSSSSGALANLPGNVANQIQHAVALDFAQSTQVVLYVMAAMMALALLAALAHPGGRVQAAEGADEPAGMLDKDDQAAASDDDEDAPAWGPVLKKIVIFFAWFVAIYLAIKYL